MSYKLIDFQKKEDPPEYDGIRTETKIEVAEFRSEVHTKFEVIDDKIANIDSWISSFETRLNNLDNVIHGLDTKIDNRLTSIDTRINNIDIQLYNITEKVNKSWWKRITNHVQLQPELQPDLNSKSMVWWRKWTYWTAHKLLNL